MPAPFKRFVVHTEPNDSSRFHIYVSDLSGVLEMFEKKNPRDEGENYQFCLKRAIFIEQAIQKAIDEAKP